MQNLWVFFARHFHWLLFLLLEVASVVMLFRYNSYQGSVWISSANMVAGMVYDWRATVEQYFTLTRVNEELTQRNLVLEQQVGIMRQQLADKGREEWADKALDSLWHSLSMIPAKVVANTVSKTDNFITIDRGSADGVAVDMGVVSGNGLVGVVYLVGDHYSVVIPVLNSYSRISCAIRGRGYFGYLQWSGGNPLEAYVEDVPRHARFQKGDWIETSGYSSIFPAGISVGKIVGIYNSGDGLSYRLKVHLSTDFACLRDVCVINDRGLAERMHLQQALRDSLELQKLKK